MKRFISNVDGASFYNAPFNLEPIEFNLRNSLIKKCSDVYRKQQSKLKPNEKRCTSSFFNYLTYLTSVKLLKNSILLMLNVLKIGFSSSYFMRVQDFSTVYVFKEVKYLYSWTYYVIKYVLFIYITTYMDIYVKKNSNTFFFFFMHYFSYLI